MVWSVMKAVGPDAPGIMQARGWNQVGPEPSRPRRRVTLVMEEMRLFGSAAETWFVRRAVHAVVARNWRREMESGMVVWIFWREISHRDTEAQRGGWR
jgi:hypothetical protein